MMNNDSVSNTPCATENAAEKKRADSSLDEVFDGNVVLYTDTSERLPLYISSDNDGLSEEHFGDTSLSSDASETNSVYHSFVSDGSSKEDFDDSFVSCLEDTTRSREESLFDISPKPPNRDGLSEELCEDYFFSCLEDTLQTREENLSNISPRPLNSYGLSNELCGDSFVTCFEYPAQTREEEFSKMSPKSVTNDGLSEELYGDPSFGYSEERTRTSQASENEKESAKSAASRDFKCLSEKIHGLKFNFVLRDSIKEESTLRDNCKDLNVSSAMPGVQG
ncbi:hypothetical protein KIN20_005979 [Parelaphostrongylus tenuis]|uniref:Uncharacterized protein n=1 Tax=Parelaphostrongylus tenuis TaxID=148309 RepID=A0AAD5M0Z6_PARTN|nr:hypothetical protein KIN20_005979 [Parelaphostrongylus tenuis]